MKELIFQKDYFINTIENYPNLNYDAICLNLISEYHCNIKYASTQFNNYKHNIKKEKIIEDKIEELLNEIQYGYENLLKVEFKFTNQENKLEKIKIYGISISLNLLKDKNINQYFVDRTHKVVPYNNEFKCLLILNSFNYRLNLYQLSLVALLTSETSEIYTKFYFKI